MKKPTPFIPHAECTVASGDCFTEGRCLRMCRNTGRRPEEDTLPPTSISHLKDVARENLQMLEAGWPASKVDMAELCRLILGLQEPSGEKRDEAK